MTFCNCLLHWKWKHLEYRPTVYAIIARPKRLKLISNVISIGLVQMRTTRPHHHTISQETKLLYHDRLRFDQN